jgi:hypothetical protein
MIETNDEEWDMSGQELSDADITGIMEERWNTPLTTVHPTRPMENNQTIPFVRRLVDEEEEERSIFPPKDPLELFQINIYAGGPLELFHELSNGNPPRPSTPMHLSDLRAESGDKYTERVITKIIVQPHQATLCLAKNASIERIIEIFKRRTGLNGVRFSGVQVRVVG